MARKQLIKGANAQNVEERIARVPEDLGPGENIFKALRRLEESAPTPVVSPAPEPPPSPSTTQKKSLPVSKPKAQPSVKATAAKVTVQKKLAKQPKKIQEIKPEVAREPEVKPPEPENIHQASFKEHKTSMFQKGSDIHLTKKERELVIKCCTDYRNHLPIYLKAVQEDVRVIDEIIRKCIKD